jgi:hypothetical protein
VLVFGHVATATLTCHAFDRRVDLRVVVFLTLLADIIDKPLGLVVFRETINNGRVWFHSLSVNLLLTVLLIVARKPLVYPLALWMHQLCDRMWMRPWVALWPFTGSFSYRDMELDVWVYNVLNPYNVWSDALGIVALALLAWRYGLFDRAALKRWLRTGRLAEAQAATRTHSV